MAELVEPFGAAWDRLEWERGGLDAARALARLLHAAEEHREERVSEALTSELAGGGSEELAVLRLLTGPQPRETVAVPEALRGHEVEATPAAVYDRLLAGVAPWARPPVRRCSRRTAAN